MPNKKSSSKNPSYKIQMKKVKKTFGSKKVLTGVDLHVKEAESLVIIGGSGSGKSVTIKSIIGLIGADSGQILVDGQDIMEMSAREKENVQSRIGMLFQGGALFDSQTVWENITFGVRAQTLMGKDEAISLAQDKLKAVGLKSDTAFNFPAELSGGMQKRVALARAIAANPEIIFFDEPTTGLDPIMADVINDLIVQCVKDLGATTITITHDMASVRKIADEVAMIYDGKIIWQDSIKKLENSKNKYVDQFIHGRADGPIQTAA